MDEARHNEIVALAKEVISESSPVGDPIRYDESFEALQAELDLGCAQTSQANHLGVGHVVGPGLEREANAAGARGLVGALGTLDLGPVGLL